MNCPKCGAEPKSDWRYTAMDQWSCGTCEPVGYAVQESHLCLRNQLAVVTAERDALLAAAKYAYKTLDGGSGLHPRSIVGVKVLDKLLAAITQAEETP